MKNYIEREDKKYWQAITALFLGSFVTFALLYCTQPLIPVFSQEFNIPPSVASLSISLATGALAIFMLVMSWLSDVKGRKLIMAVSLLSTAVLAVVLAYSPDFRLLLIIRALQGMLLAGFPAIAMAYINEEFHPRNIGLVMGIYVSGNTVGGMSGRVIVSALTDFFSWQIALGSIGVISFFVSIWFWLSLPESRNFQPKKKSLKEILQALSQNLQEGELLTLYAVGFLSMGSFVTLYNYISYPLLAAPYYLSQTIVGCIFVVYLVGTFSSTFMGKLADNIGSSKVLCLAISIMLIGGMITLNINLFLKIIGIAVFTFGFFGTHSVASSGIARCAVSNKAQASSLYLLCYYAGSSLVGAIGGRFLLWHGWSGVVLLISSSLVVALVIAVHLFVTDARYKVCAEQHN
jgi:YNFM family putative membrane transporter